MGQGYFVVVSFGIVVDRSTFRRTIKDILDADKISDRDLEKLATKNGIEFHYEQQDKPQTYFIYSTNKYWDDARCGGYQTFDFQHLQSPPALERLTQFAQEHFPQFPISCVMYAYQG